MTQFSYDVARPDNSRGLAAYGMKSAIRPAPLTLRFIINHAADTGDFLQSRHSPPAQLSEALNCCLFDEGIFGVGIGHA
jgi:hypothetical protein